MNKPMKRYIQLIPYFYLVAAIVFAFDGFYSLFYGDKNPVLSFLFSGLAIFMFFFRRRFKNRFDK